MLDVANRFTVLTRMNEVKTVEMKELILQVARDEFMEKGFQEASMEKISWVLKRLERILKGGTYEKKKYILLGIRVCREKKELLSGKRVDRNPWSCNIFCSISDHS